MKKYVFRIIKNRILSVITFSIIFSNFKNDRNLRCENLKLDIISKSQNEKQFFWMIENKFVIRVSITLCTLWMRNELSNINLLTHFGNPRTHTMDWWHYLSSVFPMWNVTAQKWNHPPVMAKWMPRIFEYSAPCDWKA